MTGTGAGRTGRRSTRRAAAASAAAAAPTAVAEAAGEWAAGATAIRWVLPRSSRRPLDAADAIRRCRRLRSGWSAMVGCIRTPARRSLQRRKCTDATVGRRSSGGRAIQQPCQGRARAEIRELLLKATALTHAVRELRVGVPQLTTATVIAAKSASEQLVARTAERDAHHRRVYAAPWHRADCGRTFSEAGRSTAHPLVACSGQRV